MSQLIETCQELFCTSDLYNVLGVTNEASKQEIKKGYYKQSLTCHPDRATGSDKETATRKFQALSQVYQILSDDGHRAEYDETGNVGDETSIIDEDRDWENYWRILFPKVTLKDIQEFSLKYKGSDEELNDLKNTYTNAKGDMDIIMSNMLCGCHDDEARFTELIHDLIQEGKLPDFPAFSKETKRKKNARIKKAQAEAKEAEEEAKKLKLDDTEDSLRAMISQRQASRAAQADSFLSQLEAKYASGAKKGKKASKK